MQTKKLNSHDFTTKAIGLTVAKDRGSLIALLKKFGVNVDNKITDDELIISVLAANRTNNKFRNELKDILKEKVSGNIKNFTGESGFFFTGEASFFNMFGENDLHGTTTPTTTTRTRTGVGNFLNNNLDTLLNQGLSTIGTAITNKSNQKLADTALQIEAEKTKQAALLAASGKAGGSTGSAAGMSTGAKVAIAVGIVAVIGVIVFLVKKK